MSTVNPVSVVFVTLYLEYIGVKTPRNFFIFKSINIFFEENESN